MKETLEERAIRKYKDGELTYVTQSYMLGYMEASQQQDELKDRMLEILLITKNKVKEFVSESRQLRSIQLNYKMFKNQEDYNKYVNLINKYTLEDYLYLNKLKKLIKEVEQNKL